MLQIGVKRLHSLKLPLSTITPTNAPTKTKKPSVLLTVASKRLSKQKKTMAKKSSTPEDADTN